MSPGRLLVIEDDPPSRSMLVQALKRNGYAIEGVGDAIEAQRCLQTEGTGQFDGVLVDLRLPRMDGLQFMTWLEEVDPHLGAALLSAQNVAEMQDGRDHPSLLFRLHKPVPFPELASAAQTLVAFTREQRVRRAGAA